MSKTRLTAVVTSLSVATLLAFAGSALAQAPKAPKKKMSYEEAWTFCKKHVDTLPWDQHGQRYARGASCMKRFGYKI